MKHKTILDLLNESVEKYGDNPYLYEARKGTEYISLTYKQVQEQSRQFAAGLIALGIEAGDRIALISEGKNNWVIGELGILHAGAISVPLSVKLQTEQDLSFRINHSDCVAVLASDLQIEKLRPIKGSFTTVKHYILLDPEEHPEKDERSFESVMEAGKTLLESNPATLQERMDGVQPDSLANISYTSGTTANPKGIMLSHNNYVCNAEQAVECLNGIPSHYRTLLILPWDHSFGHTAGVYSFMKCGASIASVAKGKSPMEILRNVPKSIKAINPHILMSVPALASNFRKNIETEIEKKGKFTAILFKKALKTAYKYNKEGFNKGGSGRLMLSIYDKLIFSKIRQSFSSNMDFFIGGGALLDIELQRFFYAIGIPMYQGYGLSEATPIISANSPHAHKLGSSGKPVPHMDLKIVDDKLQEVAIGEKGEIIIRGGNVMKGYWKNPEATAETIVDGWLRTGDMGYMDKDGYLYVLGRTKSLLISDDGEKFSPEGIEESIVATSPYIDQCVLYNNQSPYTTALIVPNATELKKAGADAAQAALLIEKAINEYRSGGKHDGLFPHRWIPSSFAVIEEPFSEQNGLMNSTMKLVKHKIYEVYASRIASLYTTEGKQAASPENLEALRKIL
ncbi:AMP-dependent synthetase/ligase [Proteiniphilum sp.]|uniref:AMP-dependent synthetase/ligase n=1 Tax=Proteiniphilum sp. TaxID=1926877 RepID=UPI002B201700|nr:AMP-binding protein [Proteiniphilum sp.]MEA4917353.1 AMP-binding protein [Proteiniphilum sp.]